MLLYEILLLCLVTIVVCGHNQIQQESSSPSPMVCTTHAGCMRGKEMLGYEAFMGIPYALPPIGELRFSNPQPFPKSSQTINATVPKAECTQKYVGSTVTSGAEDCLFLNIYRPVRHEDNNNNNNNNNNSKLLPVMVYIHEGGFLIGTANPNIIGPDHFMHTKEVILVTIAYRLGVFGYLSTNDSAIPGNFGMKDQRLALKWIQQNIEEFGGDAKQVTIFGLSAGGISVHLHMLSKNSEGLFQRAISMSGTATSPITFQKNPVQIARQTAANCNISHAESLETRQLLRELRKVSAETLQNADGNLRYWDVDPQAIYTPVIENSDTSDTFLNRSPSEILKLGDYKPVPYIAGVVPDEGAVRAAAIWENQTLRASFNKNFDYLLEALLLLPPQFNRTRLDSIMAKVIDEYFDGKHELTKRGLVDAITDFWFHYPLYHDSKLFLHNIQGHDNAPPLYLYRFNYTGPQSFIQFYAQGFPNLDYGVVHGDDLLYLFNMSITQFRWRPQDREAIEKYVQFFVDFALNKKSFAGKECEASKFPKVPGDTICDFVTFENGANDEFVMETQNKFLNGRANFLEELLKE